MLILMNVLKTVLNSNVLNLSKCLLKQDTDDCYSETTPLFAAVFDTQKRKRPATSLVSLASLRRCGFPTAKRNWRSKIVAPI